MIKEIKMVTAEVTQQIYSSLSVLAMVGQALPDLYYCLVYPAGWGWEGGRWA